jgi:hypothetical protein
LALEVGCHEQRVFIAQDCPGKREVGRATTNRGSSAFGQLRG